jgi:hypothetical protein
MDHYFLSLRSENRYRLFLGLNRLAPASRRYSLPGAEAHSFAAHNGTNKFVP